MGRYFPGQHVVQLRLIYDELQSRLVLERTHEEVSFVFAGLAALLMLIAAILSLSWFGRAV